MKQQELIECGERIDKTPILQKRFIVPPFSVLDTRQGYWQARKREWLALGIEGELGRASNMEHKGVLHKSQSGVDDGEVYNGGDCWRGSGSSIFDPVLCEIIYKWFCPEGGFILDPFAGGSVRGIVAGILGYRYFGIDLSEAQVAENRRQARDIKPEVAPCWVTADAREVKTLILDYGGQFNLLFTCPPYYDLEVYSEDSRDLSTAATYAEFLKAYREIIKDCATLLRPNSFAAIVVSEIRGKDGNYRGLVKDTIDAMEDAGLKYYNEAVLINVAGSLPIRITRQFEAKRKLGRVHQNVIIGLKA